jgi:hypothetical protein
MACERNTIVTVNFRTSTEVWSIGPTALVIPELLTILVEPTPRTQCRCDQGMASASDVMSA